MGNVNEIGTDVMDQAAEAVSNVNGGNPLKTAVVFGFGVLTGIASCKVPRLIKAAIQKRKTAVEQKKELKVVEEVTEVEDPDELMETE